MHNIYWYSRVSYLITFCNNKKIPLTDLLISEIELAYVNQLKLINNRFQDKLGV